MIAFTNHALDHMLLSLLDAGITRNIVRLGIRTSDKRMDEYTLEHLEQLERERERERDREMKSWRGRNVGTEYKYMAQLEDEMQETLQNIQTPSDTWSTVSSYLQKDFPHHLASFEHPPSWIDRLAKTLRQDIEAEGEWIAVKKKRYINVPDTIYSFWKTGQDISFIQPPQPPQNTAQSVRRKVPNQEVLAAELRQEYSERMRNFFIPLGFSEGEFPSVPATSRPIEGLMWGDSLWRMSIAERQALSAHWEDEMKTEAYYRYRYLYKRQRKEYEAACKRYNDAKDEVSSSY